MLKCIAVDDEPLALEKLKNYISKIPFLQLSATCTSAIEAMTVLHGQSVDLIFIDINMPDLSGLDFVKSLTQKPMVVFTTAYADYAIQGYKVDAVDYLLKPFGFDEFLTSANKAREKYMLMHQSHPTIEAGEENGENEFLFVKCDYKIMKIRIADIKYVESMSEYVRIFLEGESRPIITLATMKKIAESLPAQFMRVHRSYIVNLKKITEISRKRIIFDKDVYIPIGEMYQDEFQAFINSHYVGKDKI